MSASPLGVWWRAARPYRGLVVLVNALALAEAAALLALPWLMGALVAVYLGSSFHGFGVATLVLAAAAVLCAQAVLALATRYLQAALAEDVVSDLRGRLHQQLLDIPVSAHRERPRGDVLSVLFHDAAVVGRAQVGCWVAMVPMVVLAVGAGRALVMSQPALATLTLALAPLAYLLVRIVSRRVRPLADLTTRVEGEGSALAEAHLGTLRTAKAYGAERQLAEQFAGYRARARLAGKRFALACAAIGPLGRIAGLLTVVLALWVSAQWVSATGVGFTMGPAALVTFVLYGLVFLRPLGAGLALYGDAQRGVAASQRIDELLLLPAEGRGVHVAEPQCERARLSIEGLGFCYPGRRALFRDFSMQLQPGEMVGLYGPNGIGKSTLLALILGFERAQRGRIALDGMAIDQWDLAAYRRWFSWSGQGFEFLPMSLACNVAAGHRQPDRDRVRWALDAVRATDLLEGLAGGLDAPLGPGGEPLSAGQAQRIALARALYRPAPILLLDEPGSMLDADAEAHLLDSLRERLDGRSVFLVSHRRESLARVDQLIEIEPGGYRAKRKAHRGAKIIVGPWRGAR